MKEINLYQKMFLIRKFESRLLELFAEGKLSGTTHTCVGQEAVAVGVIENLEKNDVIFSNHRCHGHFLAMENDPKGLLAEILGLREGVCGGRGGSQHLHKNNFFSNGIQGSFLPIVVGMALAEKKKKSNSIVVAFIGDGTWGQGVVYESLNIASLWEVPLLIVCEDNGYAQSTEKKINTAGLLKNRPKAFGLKCDEIDSLDVEKFSSHMASVVMEVRNSKKTIVQIVVTNRFNAHSKGDDHRASEEIRNLREYCDPLKILGDKIDPLIRFNLEKTIENDLYLIEESLFNESK